MKDPSGYIRTWIYTALYQKVLYGGVYVPVYSIPPKDQSMPYIIIGEQSSGPDVGAKDCYITRHSASIEIYQSYKGTKASYIPVNAISNAAMILLRRRGQPSGLTGFNCISHVIDGIFTDRMVWEDTTVTMKVINMTFLIEELASETEDATADSTVITADSTLYTADME